MYRVFLFSEACWEEDADEHDFWKAFGDFVSYFVSFVCFCVLRFLANLPKCLLSQVKPVFDKWVEQNRLIRCSLAFPLLHVKLCFSPSGTWTKPRQWEGTCLQFVLAECEEAVRRVCSQTVCCRFRQFQFSREDCKMLDEDSAGGGLVAEFGHMVGRDCSRLQEWAAMER